MMMRRAAFWPSCALVLVLVAALLGACATTQLTNEWKSPDYSAGPMRKVLVVGVSKQPSTRRVFEDEFAARLKAAGIEGIPSYNVLKEDGPVDRAVLESAVKETGADGVLVVRLVKRERQTQVSPTYPAAASSAGFYGGYSGAWTGYYEPATVYQYDVVTLESSLYSPAQAKLVWSATTESFAPTDVKKETGSFADLIIGALRKQRIV